MSVAIALLLLTIVVLLVYVFYDKNKRKSVNEYRPKTVKIRNVPDQMDSAYQTIDELKNNESAYAEIEDKNKTITEETNETNENTTVNSSTYVAVYTKVEKNNSKRKSGNDEIKKNSENEEKTVC